jgi:hypothetical protein
VKQQQQNAWKGLAMTEFAEDLRHRCRNPHCRMKLKEPVGNPRDAFCARGCYESFHLRRCRVCEKPLEAKYRKIKPKNDGDHTKFVKAHNSSPTCGATDCKRRWRQKDGTGRFSAPKQATGYQGSQKSNLRKETPAAQALFSAIQRPKSATARRVVAGPPLTPNQLHCATVPDGSDYQWKGGEYERLEAKNCAALKAAEQAEIEANGEFTEPEWREVISPDGIRCFVTRFRDGRAPLAPLPADDTVKRSDQPHSPIVPIADDVSIPDFLKREPAAVSESLDGILEAAE